MTSTRPDLRAMAASPATFRAGVVIDTGAGPRRLAAVLDDWQRADFVATDDAWRAVAGHDVEPTFRRAYLERPRGHAKTSDLALSASWALAFSQRQLSIVAAAADRDQAKLLRDAIAKLVLLNPWLAGTLDVQTWKVANTRTGSELVILSSDAATSYGLTPDAVLIDELTHWQSRDLWDSLISAAAKRAGCLVTIISNAGFGETWQWELREAIRSDPAWLFSRLDGPRASWITADRLAEQRRLLPAIAYRRLWLNEWSAGSGDALDADLIEAALTLAGPPAGPRRGESYFSGLDLSTRRDSTALVVLGWDVGWSEEKPRSKPRIATALAAMRDLGLADEPSEPDADIVEHPGSGRLRLAEVQLWTPSSGSRIDLDAVERAIADAHARWGLSALFADSWQAELLCQRLSRAGIPVQPIQGTASIAGETAAVLLDAFGERQIDLFPHDALLADLRALRVVERPGFAAGFRLVSPRGNSDGGTRHGDLASALQLALLAARRGGATAGRIDGPLVCWP